MLCHMLPLHSHSNTHSLGSHTCICHRRQYTLQAASLPSIRQALDIGSQGGQGAHQEEENVEGILLRLWAVSRSQGRHREHPDGPHSASPPAHIKHQNTGISCLQHHVILNNTNTDTHSGGLLLMTSGLSLHVWHIIVI